MSFPSLPATLVERDVLSAARLFEFGDDALAMGRLVRRYRDVPASTAFDPTVQAKLSQITGGTVGTNTITSSSD